MQTPRSWGVAVGHIMWVEGSTINNSIQFMNTKALTGGLDDVCPSSNSRGGLTPPPRSLYSIDVDIQGVAKLVNCSTVSTKLSPVQKSECNF